MKKTFFAFVIFSLMTGAYAFADSSCSVGEKVVGPNDEIGTVIKSKSGLCFVRQYNDDGDGDSDRAFKPSQLEKVYPSAKNYGSNGASVYVKTGSGDVVAAVTVIGFTHDGKIITTQARDGSLQTVRKKENVFFQDASCVDGRCSDRKIMIKDSDGPGYGGYSGSEAKPQTILSTGNFSVAARGAAVVTGEDGKLHLVQNYLRSMNTDCTPDKKICIGQSIVNFDGSHGTVADIGMKNDGVVGYLSCDNSVPGSKCKWQIIDIHSKAALPVGVSTEGKVGARGEFKDKDGNKYDAVLYDITSVDGKAPLYRLALRSQDASDTSVKLLTVDNLKNFTQADSIDESKMLTCTSNRPTYAQQGVFHHGATVASAKFTGAFYQKSDLEEQVMNDCMHMSDNDHITVDDARTACRSNMKCELAFIPGPVDVVNAVDMMNQRTSSSPSDYRAIDSAQKLPPVPAVVVPPADSIRLPASDGGDAQ